MLTNTDLRSKVDAFWNKFWSGGISNRLKNLALGLPQRLIGIVAACLILSSCDPYHTDGFTYNDKARPGETVLIKEVNFENISPDQHFAGYIRVNFFTRYASG